MGVAKGSHGEKGIGRLAIASIGNQVLILTKAKYESSSKIVAAFICWDVFELTGLNIDDIVIPVKEFDNIPTKEEIISLKNECINSLKEVVDKGKISKDDYSRIDQLIKSFNSDIADVYSIIGGTTSLQTGGTHFFVSPVSDSLIPDIEGDGDSSEATKMEKMLMGFHNTMTPNHPTPTIDIAFRDYRHDDGTFVSLLEEKQFFTPEEFEEYKIPQEPILKDDTLELLKSMMKEKKMSTITFLKAFPRKKRVEIVDMLRGAYPIPIDFKELSMIGQVIELDRADIYNIWEDRIKQVLETNGMNLNNNSELIKSMFECSKKYLNI